jgi:hypothetical protein
MPTDCRLQIRPDERLVGDLYQKRQIVRPERRRGLPQIAIAVNLRQSYPVLNDAILPAGIFPN